MSIWPAIAHEQKTWHPLSPTSHGPAATRERKYHAAVPAFIAQLAATLPAEALAEAEAAGISLARFDAELGDRVAAFAPVLLRSEAASSSQIENLTASARAILTAELGGKSSSNATQIAANTSALNAALSLADELSASTILSLHAVLMHSQPRHTPGQWRLEPVWIGTNGDSPVGATYVGPDHTRIPTLIEDLIRFALRDDLPALVHVALAHAQFETIHPFSDGNGRTGRALAQSMLRRRGITRNVAVPVSAGLLSNVAGYHEALMSYRAGDVVPIVLAFSRAAEKAVTNARQLVGDIETIRDGWANKVQARKSSGVWKLLDIIARKPVLNATTAAAELGGSASNAYPPLRALVDAGILKSKAEHQLGPFWRSDEILGAIDAFAERAGRRSGS
jgi:Fic family protein